MTEIQKQTLARAVNLLNALRVDYKIIASDGSEFGTLEVVRKKTKTYTRRVTPGAYKSIIAPKLAFMDVGDVAQFPISDLAGIAGASPEGFRSALSAHSCLVWGNGNCTTITDTHIEILRLG